MIAMGTLQMCCTMKESQKSQKRDPKTHFIRRMVCAERDECGELIY